MESSRKELSRVMKKRIAIRQAYDQMISDHYYTVSFGDMDIVAQILKKMREQMNPDDYSKIINSITK